MYKFKFRFSSMENFYIRTKSNVYFAIFLFPTLKNMKIYLNSRILILNSSYGPLPLWRFHVCVYIKYKYLPWPKIGPFYLLSERGEGFEVWAYYYIWGEKYRSFDRWKYIFFFQYFVLFSDGCFAYDNTVRPGLNGIQVKCILLDDCFLLDEMEVSRYSHYVLLCSMNFYWLE